jgi:bacterial/archaeal transporter family-2 protein
MNNPLLLLLSFSVGIMVVIQGGINSRLGVMLNNSLVATGIALVMSASVTLLVVVATVRQLPTAGELRQIPAYMWFAGGVFSFIAVSLFYYVIPRVGISTAVTFSLTGQVIFAAVASHFGWFGMPLEPVSIKKIAGMLVMMAGVVLVKS